MITAEVAKEAGLSPENEKSPLDIIGNNAMTSRDIADKISSYYPEGYPKMTYSCARQKLIRLEKKGEITRTKFEGLIHWYIT